MNKRELVKAVKDLNNHFVNKIIEGKYKILAFGKYSYTITIDKEYVFTIWVANGENVLYVYSAESFMILRFTPEEQHVIYKQLSKLTISAIRKKYIRRRK